MIELSWDPILNARLGSGSELFEIEGALLLAPYPHSRLIGPTRYGGLDRSPGRDPEIQFDDRSGSGKPRRSDDKVESFSGNIVQQGGNLAQGSEQGLVNWYPNQCDDASHPRYSAVFIDAQEVYHCSAQVCDGTCAHAIVMGG
ncbi:hypothetical protein LJR161_004389 [Variovorax paradoxus]|uniref:hypothetical protein n=1 Tax=Variovorax paradoxus TaxID=34073 RepID=UPI003ECD1575